MNEDKIFLDTNIIVYGYDISAGEKHSVAKAILMDLWNSGSGVLSSQVLQEFFVSVTRKIPKPLGVKEARRIVADFLKWEIVFLNGEKILEAIDLHAKHRFSFWDSMILSPAVSGDARILYSEDLVDGFKLDGPTVK